VFLFMCKDESSISLKLNVHAMCVCLLCVLGIESLVRSLKEALQITNLEVPKQGLLLLTEILER